MSVLFIALIFTTSLACLLGLWLSWSAKKWPSNSSALVEQVNRLLPQIQCGQCSYAGCLPYAEAIIKGEAINRCPPGGDSTVLALAALLQRDSIPIMLENTLPAQPQIALINEDQCIGCNKCLDACPVDAIIGAPKHVYTVVSDACTGCQLCLAPCPVDCISFRLTRGQFVAQQNYGERPSLRRGCTKNGGESGVYK